MYKIGNSFVVLRYDLLCIEGIARALRVFLGKAEAPRYKLVYPAGGEADLLTVTVKPEVYYYYPLMFHSRSDPSSDADKTNSPILRLCHPAKCQIYSTILRVFHRSARQAASEYL